MSKDFLRGYQKDAVDKMAVFLMVVLEVVRVEPVSITISKRMAEVSSIRNMFQ